MTLVQRLRAPLAALAALLALAAAGCGGGSSSGGGSDRTITIGVQAKILQTYYPQLAERLGYLKKEGVKVKIIETDSPANATQAMIGGSMDLFLGGPEALPAAEQGTDIRYIAGASNRAIWDIITSKDITDVHQLEGKKFGTSGPTSISTAAVKAALKAQGVNPDSLKYVVAGSTGNRYAALVSGQIQGAPLGIPVNYKASEGGKFNDLGAPDLDLGAAPIAAVEISVRKQWANANKDTLQRFLRAYQRVIDAFYDPAKTETIVKFAAKDLDVKPEFVRRAIKTLFLDKKTGGKVLPRNGQIDVKAFQNGADEMTALKVLKGKLDVSKFVDMSYLKAAQRSLGR